MNKPIKFNKVTKRLPKHLLKFIEKQPYKNYTAQNQAVWRYVMRMNVDYLGMVAHESYLKGLDITGISVETSSDVVCGTSIFSSVKAEPPISSKPR